MGYEGVFSRKNFFTHTYEKFRRTFANKFYKQTPGIGKSKTQNVYTRALHHYREQSDREKSVKICTAKHPKNPRTITLKVQ